MKLDIQYFLSSRHAKWFVFSLIILFLLLTLNEFSKLLGTFYSPATPSAVQDTIRAPAKKNNYDFILPSSLFGVYVSNDLSGDKVKKSMLNITLVGILLENTAQDSQVIIRSANGVEKNYKVDDEIPGGVLIKKIMKEGILVEHDGNLESVSLPKNELIFEPAAEPLRNEE